MPEQRCFERAMSDSDVEIVGEMVDPRLFEDDSDENSYRYVSDVGCKLAFANWHLRSRVLVH